jgi:hypothetical protein
MRVKSGQGHHVPFGASPNNLQIKLAVSVITSGHDQIEIGALAADYTTLERPQNASEADVGWNAALGSQDEHSDPSLEMPN